MHARARAGGGMSDVVIDSHCNRVTVQDGIDLADDDGHTTAVIVVVTGHVGECPVGSAAGDVSEGSAEVEASQGLAFDTQA